MPLCLAKTFGSMAEMWLRLQAAFDLAEVRKRKADQIDAVRGLGMINESTTTVEEDVGMDRGHSLFIHARRRGWPSIRGGNG